MRGGGGEPSYLHEGILIGLHYFAISAAGACWQHILQTRQVGVYVPGEIGNDAVFEVTIVTETTA